MELHYARVTSKGQITIPAAIRERLEINPGSTILFTVMTDGSIRVNHPAQDIEAVLGSVAFPPGMTIERLTELADKIGTAEAVYRYRRSMGEENIEMEDFLEIDEPAIVR